MTKVFIGGSRHVSRLNETVKDRIDRIVEQGFPVVVGDANGADKAVQLYLNSKKYEHVEVFCAAGLCRNNLGRWHTRTVSVDPRLSGTAEFHSAKDRAMTHEATVGLMIWDGKSAGTLMNVLRLLKQKKNAVVYSTSEKRFLELTKLEQWRDFLSNCDVALRNKISDRTRLEDRAAESYGKGARLQPLPPLL